jgi:hypothetical protein
MAKKRDNFLKKSAVSKSIDSGLYDTDAIKDFRDQLKNEIASKILHRQSSYEENEASASEDNKEVSKLTSIETNKPKIDIRKYQKIKPTENVESELDRVFKVILKEKGFKEKCL